MFNRTKHAFAGLWVTIMAALLVTACGGSNRVVVGYHALNPTEWAEAERLITRLAKFEMNCKSGDFDWEVIGTKEGIVLSVAVAGCGRRAVYQQSATVVKWKQGGFTKSTDVYGKNDWSLVTEVVADPYFDPKTGERAGPAAIEPPA